MGHTFQLKCNQATTNMVNISFVTIYAVMILLRKTHKSANGTHSKLIKKKNIHPTQIR